MTWVVSASQPASAQPEETPGVESNMIINPGFEMGLKGWQWEANAYPWPEGIFEAEGSVTISPASPAASNRWAQMDARARAEVGDTTGVAGGQLDVVLFQSFEYDHNSVLPVVRHDGLVGTTSLVLSAVLTENAKADLTVTLELENTRTGQLAFANVAAYEVLGPCPDEPIMTVSTFQPWAQTAVMASMVDAIEGDKLIAQMRVHVTLEASGAGSAASVVSQTRVDRIAIVEFSAEDQTLSGSTAPPMFSAARTHGVDDADEITFADLVDSLTRSFTFDSTVRTLAGDVIGFSGNAATVGNAKTSRAVTVVPQGCLSTDGAACGPIIIQK
jgi:hypothetical protein